MDAHGHARGMVALVAAASVWLAASNGALAQMMGGPMMGGTRMWDRGGMGWPDTLEVVTVSGVALVDAGRPHALYGLDTDGDSTANYQLSFGPWWYTPPSGATRPQDGDSLTVEGGSYSIPGWADLVVVFRVNGEEWREPAELLPWSGGWMHGTADTTYFHAPQDSLSWLGMPGSTMAEMRRRMAGMMGGWTVLDSAYVHFEAVHPDSMPGMADSALVAGFHVGFSDGWGNDLMGGAMVVHLGYPVHMRLHYDPEPLAAAGWAEEGLVCRALGGDSIWVDVPGAVVDSVTNTLSLGSTQVAAYYALFAPAGTPTAVAGQGAAGARPAAFSLAQNTPNPFNPQTLIRFSLASRGPIRLVVYNALGQPVRILVDGPREAGDLAAVWNGRDEEGRAQPSGLYLCRLTSGGRTAVRKMVLLR
ncbi:MAG: T9SS type A sorting domain-containing protein [Candidatus Latescibacterota bacterium]